MKTNFVGPLKFTLTRFHCKCILKCYHWSVVIVCALCV